MSDRVVIVTGGAKGIGGACVRLFHEEGAQVAIFDTDDNVGKNLASELGERAKYYRCDVSNREAVQTSIDQVIRDFGEITVLVNNAGILSYSTVEDATEDEWDQVIGVNLKGAFLCCKYAIPSMKKRGEGVIINVSSVQAFISQEKVAAYTTSKTALLGLTRSIAVDFAPDIRCVAVCPGTIDTPMLRSAIQLSPDPDAVMAECIDMHLLKKIGAAEEVASMVTYLASSNAGFITGQAFRVDGGLGVRIPGSKQDEA